MAATSAETTTEPGIPQGECPSAIVDSSSCFTLRSYSDGRLLGTPPGSAKDSYLAQDHPAGPSTLWETLLVGDGKVRFHNLGVDRCMNIYNGGRAWLDECHAATAADETFYIRGVDNAVGRYRLVAGNRPDQCLTEDGDNPGLKTCDSASQTQLWVFASAGLVRQADDTWKVGGTDWVRPLAWRLALQECDKDQACQWTTAPAITAAQLQGAPTVTSTACAGPIEQNSAPAAQGATVSLSYTETRSDTYARTVESTKSLAVKGSGALLPDDLSFGFSYSRTDSRTSSQTWANASATLATRSIPAIPAGQWAWFAETAYGRQLPGTWTFGLGSKTQFTAQFSANSPFIFPSYKPGQEASKTSVVITPYTGLNPPDADCSAPLSNATAFTAEQTVAGATAGQAQSVGMAFQTGPKRVEVSRLGRLHRQSCPAGSPTAGPVQVGLFADGGAPGGPLSSLGTVTVKLGNAGFGAYAYTALPSPVILQPNTVYYLLTAVNAGDPCWGAAHSITPDGELGIKVLYPVAEKAGGLTADSTKGGQTYDSLNMTVSD